MIFGLLSVVFIQSVHWFVLYLFSPMIYLVAGRGQLRDEWVRWHVANRSVKEWWWRLNNT